MKVKKSKPRIVVVIIININVLTNNLPQNSWKKNKYIDKFRKREKNEKNLRRKNKEFCTVKWRISFFRKC